MTEKTDTKNKNTHICNIMCACMYHKNYDKKSIDDNFIDKHHQIIKIHNNKMQKQINTNASE